MRYLDCPEDSLPWRFRQLLVQGSAAIDPAVGMSSLETLLLVSLGKFNVLPLLFSGWDCVGKEKVFLACLLFAEAAGVVGRQKWALVLSTSARVSQVTYRCRCEISRASHMRRDNLELCQVCTPEENPARWLPPGILGCSMQWKTLERLLTG